MKILNASVIILLILSLNVIAGEISGIPSTDSGAGHQTAYLARHKGRSRL